MKGLFVTGTDTGVGKTLVSRALLTAWRARGLSVGVMKPCETGCNERKGQLIPDDAVSLLEAAGSGQSLAEVCPFRFRNPVAPAMAAQLEDGDFSFQETLRIFRRIQAKHTLTLVEGAGGLLVPFESSRTAADLALKMDLPVLIVARIGLGTINHTGLTLEAARARGLTVPGVVFNRCESPEKHPMGPDEDHNPATVSRLFQVPVLGNIPFLPDGDPAKAADYLDLDAFPL